jgi:hypothetical protein
VKIEILRDTGPTTITKKWFEDGTQIDAGVVTYVLTDAEGTVLDSGTATKTGSGATTAYEVSVAVADVADVGEHELEWTRSSTGGIQLDTVSVVGSVLFAESDARSYKIVGALNVLASESDYPDQAIAEGRYRVTELLERRCGVSFVRRYGRVELAGNSSRSIGLVSAMKTHGGPGYRRRPLAVLAASVNGTALTAGELSNVYPDRLTHDFTRYDGNTWAKATGSQPPRNVSIGYEYGYEEVPWEIRQAAIALLVKAVVPRDVSSRATTFSNEDGTFRLLFPGLDRPTGDPVIDEAIVAHDERRLIA